MEAVAFVAGEPHTDHPACASPVVAAFLREWNDGLPTDAERNRLLAPLVPLIVGTASTPAVEERRSYLALDWMIRTYLPAWLDLRPELAAHAAAVRALAPIVDMATATAAGLVVRAAGLAWPSARLAAAAAARTSALPTSVAAAAVAAAAGAAWLGPVARAVGSAAAKAAGSVATAAWSAAWVAAWSSAVDADSLAPTVTALQASALDLVNRMIAVKGTR